MWSNEATDAFLFKADDVSMIELRRHDPRKARCWMSSSKLSLSI